MRLLVKVLHNTEKKLNILFNSKLNYMDTDKINKTIEYYNIKIETILNFMNTNTNLTIEDIIHNGEQLTILEYKLTALEVAKEN